MNKTTVKQNFSRFFLIVFGLVIALSAGELIVRAAKLAPVMLDFNIIYSQVFDKNTIGTFNQIEGYQPEILIFSFNNFTGKVRITLTETE